MALVKNWSKFQHFKDRRPPWIKLYRDILDDPQWHKLDPAAAKSLVMFWLIASENDGELPDVETLAFRIRKTEAEVLECLGKLSHWVVDNTGDNKRDDTAISRRYQDDAPERETEGETETELTNPDGLVAGGEPANPSPQALKKSKLPDCPHQAVIDLFHETLPICPRVMRWTGTREANLRARWRELAAENSWATETDGLDWWRKFFAYAGESKFLTGRSSTPGKEPFFMTLGWLVKPENFAKVMEGNYA